MKKNTMFNYSNKDASYYRHIFFVNDEDMEIVQSAGAIIHEEQEAFYQNFYNWLNSHPYFNEHYTEDVVMAIKESEDTLWEDLLSGQVSDEYVERQKYFGLIFAEVGIPLGAYLAFMKYYHKLVGDFFEKHNLESVKLLKSYNKITDVAIATITDGYNLATTRQLKEQNEALMQMSTPITQLWEGILLLPLVGFLDSKRAADVMMTMLDYVGKTQAKVFILDISGIAVMDTAVANYLIKITKATRLMGCVCLISGISGAVAQTIVELGIPVDEVESSGNMLEALRKALDITGQKVI